MNILANMRGDGASCLADVYEAVDSVLSDGGGVPPGAIGQLHRSIDLMKGEAGSDALVVRAEAMALTIHRLRIARLDGGDDTLHRRLRRELEIMGREWIEAVPLFH